MLHSRGRLERGSPPLRAASMPSCGMDEMAAAQACPAFASLSPVELQDILGMALRLEVDADHRVFTEGDVPDGMYIVARGSVAIVHRPGSGDEAKVARLEPGALFGEMALLLDEPRAASAVTLTPCVLLRLGRDGFTEFLESEDRAASKIILELARLACRRLNAPQASL